MILAITITEQSQEWSKYAINKK